MLEMLGTGISTMLHFIMDNIVIINIILSLIIVFFERRSPQAVWTWLLLLYFIPIVGFILYLVIGQDFHKSRMFKAKEIEGEVKYAVRRQEETIYKKQLKLANPELDRFRDLMLYNLEAGSAVLTDNNDIRIYTDGKEKFRALIHEMKQAKKYIHMQYYIIRSDELWQEIEPVLIQKAKEGVEVRVLFDSMGCRTMHKKDWNRLKAGGVQIAEFFPALLGKLQLRMNYRNHRKIVVIDGRIGFVGGFNVGREYLGLDESKQNLINTDSSQTRLALIQKGGASAVYANGSEAKYIEEAGWVQVATSQEIGIQTGSYFLSTDKYISENTDTLAKFLQAVDESTQYINDHLDESAEYLADKLGLKAEDFKENWKNYSFEPGFSEEATTHLEDIEKWGFEHGSFPKDYNVRDFINTDVAKIAFPDNVTIE